MNRRNFLKNALGATAGLAISVTPVALIESRRVEAPLYGYVCCPECGCAMLRIEEEGKMFITCCGKTFKEPTILLERVL